MCVIKILTRQKLAEGGYNEGVLFNLYCTAKNWQEILMT